MLLKVIREIPTSSEYRLPVWFGEGKSVITESVRGDDIYLMVDVCNYSMTYRISGFTNLMSPDDHFQDLKRVIGAIGGKARRVKCYHALPL